MTRPYLLLLALFLILQTACNNAGAPATEPPAAASPTPAAPATRGEVQEPTGASPTATNARPSPQAADTATSQSPTPTADAQWRYFESPEYGVQAFMWWRPDVAQRDLGLIHDMGFGWVKQGFAWRDIETHEKGSYDWWKADNIVQQVEDAGLQLVARIDRQPFWSQVDPSTPLENAPPADLDDFGDFCGELAARYRGRIAAYQVWNEPNLSREWGEQAPDPQAYTELLRVCYEAIKAADPQAIVISAGLSPTGVNSAEAMPDTDYLQGMYDAGAADYYDVLGLNAPGYAAPPEMSPEEGAEAYRHRSFVFRRVEDMRQIMVDNGDRQKQVAILEMGWMVEQDIHELYWHGVSEEEQADYLVRAYQYARENWQPWIGLMTTIYIADYDWTPDNEQWWWSIVLPDGTPRPAYEALMEMEK
ncbi:MAG: hypothetical protein ACOC8X_04335 [Chloroflexota bacterium]